MSPGCAKVSERYAELFEALPAQLTAQTRATINQTMAQGMRQTAAIIETTMQQVSAGVRPPLNRRWAVLPRSARGHSSSSWRG